MHATADDVALDNGTPVLVRNCACATPPGADVRGTITGTSVVYSGHQHMRLYAVEVDETVELDAVAYPYRTVIVLAADTRPL